MPRIKSKHLIIALLALLAWFIIGSLIALLGLDRLTADINPLKIPEFWWFYRENTEVMGWLQTGLVASGCLAVITFMLKYKRPQKLHGEARWANARDIKKAKLAVKDGILLGRTTFGTLRLGGTEHVLVEAPTRAGKGVGIVIPNLLEWQESVVVLDIKQENWEITAGFRKSLGQDVFLFNPLSAEGRTACYNPLGYFDRTNPVAVINEMQKIGQMLYPEPKDGESFWLDSARSAFIGVGAYIAATKELPFSIGEIYRQITAGDAKKRLHQIVRARQEGDNPLSKECVSAISDYVTSSDNTYSGIRQTVTSRINLWLNPYVDRATETSDFDLRQLRQHPMSLYLGVSPDNMERAAPLYNLILQQIIDLNVRELPTKTRNNVKVLMVMDEFAKLGRANMIANGFSFVAGYGLRLMPVVQSRSQLRHIYGHDNAKEIITNCGVEVIFGVKEDDISKELESRVGTYTYQARSRSRKVWEGFEGSVSFSEQRRPLLFAQEIRELPEDKMLVFRAMTPAIMATKIKYFEESKYTKLAALPAPLIKKSSRNPLLSILESQIAADKGKPMTMIAKNLLANLEVPLDNKDT
jgi:type IV secretion system protein VirD4